jgi:hypothetical protein
MNMMNSYFPEVTGSNLLGTEISVPTDLDKELNIVMVAFQRWHQNVVDSWVPFLNDLVEQNPNMDYYELPTIRRMNWLYRTMLDNGMKAGIPSQKTRRRTVTLYLDKESFRKGLGIPDESDIHLFLVKPDGTILWRDSGIFTVDKMNRLLDTIKQINSEE